LKQKLIGERFVLGSSSLLKTFDWNWQSLNRIKKLIGLSI
jgi:hypothetical protein